MVETATTLDLELTINRHCIVHTNLTKMPRKIWKLRFVFSLNRPDNKYTFIHMSMLCSLLITELTVTGLSGITKELGEGGGENA